VVGVSISREGALSVAGMASYWMEGIVRTYTKSQKGRQTKAQRDNELYLEGSLRLLLRVVFVLAFVLVRVLEQVHGDDGAVAVAAQATNRLDRIRVRRAIEVY